MEKHYRNIICTCLIISFGVAISSVNAQNVIQELQKHKKASHFVQALEKAKLQERLNKKGPFTLFVPVNSAFDELSDRQKSNTDLLLNHILTGMATKRNLKAMSYITSISGHKFVVETDNNQRLTVASYEIISSNIKADNGVIHMINGVIR